MESLGEKLSLEPNLCETILSQLWGYNHRFRAKNLIAFEKWLSDIGNILIFLLKIAGKSHVSMS